MPLSFMRDTVTIHRPAIKNRNGAEILDWQNATEHDVSNVQVVGQGTSRDFDGRTLQTDDRRTLRAPFNADIQAGDRVIWHGDVYEIDGEVFHTASPTGRVSSTRCTLVKMEG